MGTVPPGLAAYQASRAKKGGPTAPVGKPGGGGQPPWLKGKAKGKPIDKKKQAKLAAIQALKDAAEEKSETPAFEKTEKEPVQ